MKTYKEIRGSYYEDIQKKGTAQSWFYRTREEYLLRFARLSPHERVLDIACGSGMVTRKFAQTVGCSFTGLDVSQDCVRHATAQSKSEGIRNVRFLCGTFESLPFATASFDCVIASHVIEHIASPIAAMHEVKRILKPGGRFILTTPNYASLWPIAEAVFDHTCAEEGYSLHDQHISPLTFSSVKKLFDESGFQDSRVEAHYITSLPVSLFWKGLADKLFSLEQKIATLPVGSIIYARGVKP